MVHIAHLGEAVGSGTNISDAQIQSAIMSLNAKFGSGNIQFFLATCDPAGNPTTGIIRKNASVVPNYLNEGITAGLGKGADEMLIKNLFRWRNDKYLNIYIVSEIEDNNAGGGIQGYSYLLSSAPEDGIVVMYNAFGTTGNLKSFTQLNHVFVHEVGHYLSLLHTFEGDQGGLTCPIGTGDYVADTPPHIRSSSNCDIGKPNTCVSGGSTDDYIHNYMDYSSEVCQDRFTQGQIDRMRSAILDYRFSMLNPVACNTGGSTAGGGGAGENDPCGNSFPFGTFDGWETAKGGVDNGVTVFTNNQADPNRFAITFGKDYDPLVPIKIVCPRIINNLYSCKIGNAAAGAEAERLRKVFKVSAQNPFIELWYAIVLEDPQHPANIQPFMQIRILDEQGNLLYPCGEFKVIAGPDASAKGFQSIGDIQYKDWSSIGIDLTAYVGKNVVIEVINADCSAGGHYGYAYVDFACSSVGGIQTEEFCEYAPSVKVTAPSGFTYRWKHDNSTSQSTTVSYPKSGQKIEVDLISDNGCSTTISTTLQGLSNPKPNLGPDLSICEKITLNGNLVVDSYEWYKDRVKLASTSPTLIASEGGEYILISKKGNCTNSDTVYITKAEPMAIKPNYYQSCPTDSIVISLPNLPYVSYIWSDGFIGTKRVFNSPMDITFTVTKKELTADGFCITNDKVRVYIPSPLPKELPIDTIKVCNNNLPYTVDGTVNLDSVQYIWRHSGSTNPKANLTKTGLYILKRISKEGCISYDSVYIQVLTAPVIALPKKIEVCQNTPIFIDASKYASLGTIYEWLTGDTLGKIGVDSSIPKKLWVKVKVTNSVGCTTEDSVLVIVNPLPLVAPKWSSTLRFTLCDGVQTIDAANPSHGANFGYLWSNGDTTSSIKVFFTGTQTFTCTITDYSSPNKCSITLKTTVTFEAKPNLDHVKKEIYICSEDFPYTLDVSSPSHNPWTVYTWNDGTDGSKKTINSLGTHTLTVVAYDSIIGCFEEKTLTIIASPTPYVELGQDIDACDGNPIWINAKNASHIGNRFTYYWSTKDTTYRISWQKTGRFMLWVEVKDKLSGCMQRDTMLVTMRPSPVVNLPSTKTICVPNGVPDTLNAIDLSHRFAKYWWYELGSDVPIGYKGKLPISKAGTYIVKVYDSLYDCFKFDTCRVIPVVIPDFYITGQEIPNATDIDTLYVQASTNLQGMRINWHTVDGQILSYGKDSLSVVVRKNAQYWVTVNNMGCHNTRPIFVTTQPFMVNIGKDSTTFCSPYKIIGDDPHHDSKVSYKWRKLGSETVLSTEANLDISESGIFILEANNGLGITLSDTAQITILPKPRIKYKILRDPNRPQEAKVEVDMRNLRNYQVELRGKGIHKFNQTRDYFDFLVDSTGTISIIIKDSTGDICAENKAEFYLQLADAINNDLKKEYTFCDSEGLMNASPIVNLGKYRHEWTDLRNNSIVSRDSIFRIKQSNNGNYEWVYYKVTTFLEDAFRYDTVRVKFIRQPKLAIKTSQKLITVGQTVYIDLSGTQATQITSSLGDTTRNQKFTPSREGVYTIGFKASTDPLCGIDSQAIQITVKKAFLLSSYPSKIKECEDGEVVFDLFHESQPAEIEYEVKNMLTGQIVKSRIVPIIFTGSYTETPYQLKARDTQTGYTITRLVTVQFERKAETRILKNYPTTICVGDSIRLFSTGATFYFWMHSGDTTSHSLFKATKSGFYTIVLKGNLKTICRSTNDTAFIEVIERPLAKAHTLDTLHICEGESATLNASGGKTYRWTHDNSKKANALVSPLISTNYTVWVGNGFCEELASVYVKVTPKPNIKIQYYICPSQQSSEWIGNEIPNATYFWEHSGETTAKVNVTKSGEYKVRIKFETCFYVIPIKVVFEQMLESQFKGIEIKTCFLTDPTEPESKTRIKSYLLERKIPSAENRVLYAEWFKGNKSVQRSRIDGQITQYQATSDGEYRLEVRNEDQCNLLKDTVVIKSFCDARLKMPNAFTPDNDGVNDYFHPITSDLHKLYLRIVDAQNNVLFEKESDRNWNGSLHEEDTWGWDGTTNGQKVPNGTYYYYVQYKGFDEKFLILSSERSGIIRLYRKD